MAKTRRTSLEKHQRLSPRKPRDAVEKGPSVPHSLHVDEGHRCFGIVAEILEIVVDPQLCRVSAGDCLRHTHACHRGVVTERRDEIAALARQRDAPRWRIRRHHLRTQPGAGGNQPLAVRTRQQHAAFVSGRDQLPFEAPALLAGLPISSGGDERSANSLSAGGSHEIHVDRGRRAHDQEIGFAGRNLLDAPHRRATEHLCSVTIDGKDLPCVTEAHQVVKK